MNLFKENKDKRNVGNISLAAGKSKMFSIGYPKVLDSYFFLAILLDEMAKEYGGKTKILNPYEHFDLEIDNKIIGNQKIEDFKFSLSN